MHRQPNPSPVHRQPYPIPSHHTTLTARQVLLCIALNFSRSRLKQLREELEVSEQIREEEHADKVRLLRYNGVQL